MTSLADLHRAVQTTLAGKRLGQPVFVRYLWYSLDKPEAILPRLTQLTGAVSGWLGQALERLYAVGSPAAGQVTLTLEYREGGSALVSWSRSQAPGGVDLMVLGNRGAIYHDAGSAVLWDEPADFGKEPHDKQLAQRISLALTSGKPETVGGGAKP